MWHSIIRSLKALSLRMKLYRMDGNEDVWHSDVGLATGDTFNYDSWNKFHMFWQCFYFYSLEQSHILHGEKKSLKKKKKGEHCITFPCAQLISHLKCYGYFLKQSLLFQPCANFYRTKRHSGVYLLFSDKPADDAAVRAWALGLYGKV